MYYVLKRPGKGGRKDKIQCAYFGFDSETEAEKFMAWLRHKHPTALAQRRSPERLDGQINPVEVKVREFEGLLSMVLTCAEKEVNHAAA